MLYSMTGYGKSENKNEQISVTAEIKSLNSKELNINIKAPYWLKSIELEIRHILQQKLHRGKIDLFISIELSEELVLTQYDLISIKKYFTQLKNILKELDIDASHPYIIINLFREALNKSNTEPFIDNQMLSEQNKILLLNTIGDACDMLNNFRKIEGEKLESDILYQTQLLEQLTLKIKQIEPLRTQRIKEKILTTLKENLDESKINSERFEQEIIYYLEKLDINEELIRLNSHLSYFRETCKDGYNKGKKLSFIVQEMGREINTIGSKANDEQIQKLVVEMKDTLEKIKEQLNNIL